MTAIKTEGGFKPAPATPEERSKVQQIVEIMGGACNEETALNFLRRNGGNVEKTLSAVLDSATDDAPTTSGNADLSDLRAAVAGVVAPHTPPASQSEKNAVIDLTGDDDEDLSRALQASLQDQGTTFGPSTRAPDPNWAVVPSHISVDPPAISQDDQDLNQAIEASLNQEMVIDSTEDRPLEDRIRQGDNPVALCPTQPSYTYASNIIHALYFVPQVREYIAPWRPIPETPADESEEYIDPSLGVLPPSDRPASIVWSLLETFINMEFARMNELSPDKVLDDSGAPLWTNPNMTPGSITSEFYQNLAWAVETVLNANLATMWPEPPTWPRLFHLRYGNADAPPYKGPFHKEHDTSIVRVNVRNEKEPTDLLTCLSALLIDEADNFKQAMIIEEASEVLAFELIREPRPLGERHKFTFPATIYLDQFLRENASLAADRRKMRKVAMDEAEHLQASKSALLRHKGRDTLADLRSTLYYFESIAEANDDSGRQIQPEATAAKLRKVIGRVEEEVKRIDEAIEACKVRALQAVDSPELQKHKYDLRAVLVHDGLYGRNHLYSYVKHKGTWWKALEYKVTEVSEDDVLNDNIGFHLGAGPYYLLYSRSVSLEEESVHLPWPTYLKDNVKHNNKTFFDQLPYEISAGIVDPNSPPTSYATPMEEVQPLDFYPSGEPMDVDRPSSPI